MDFEWKDGDLELLRKILWYDCEYLSINDEPERKTPYYTIDTRGEFSREECIRFSEIIGREPVRRLWARQIYP